MDIDRQKSGLSVHGTYAHFYYKGHLNAKEAYDEN